MIILHPELSVQRMWICAKCLCCGSQYILGFTKLTVVGFAYRPVFIMQATGHSVYCSSEKSEKVTDSICVSQTIATTTPETYMSGFDTQTIRETQPQKVESGNSRCLTRDVIGSFIANSVFCNKLLT